MPPTFCLVFGAWISTVCAYVNESYWLSIQNDQIPISQQFGAATFRKHPKSHGQKSNTTFPALYLHDGKPIFGQTTESNNGNYCAVFNVDSEARHMCTNFRILKSNEDTLSNSKYYLIKPELFDSFWDDPVGFSDRFLVVVYDLYMDSSYFGTLHRPLSDQEPVVYAVDQNNAPVEIRGASATSNGEFIMLVVRQRHFSQTPFHGLCRPIDFGETRAKLEVDEKRLDNEETTDLA